MDSHIVGFVAVFGAMFAIANPFSGIPFFLGYTAPLTTWQQKLLGAVLTVATVWVGGVIVLYAGNAVLGFFGIDIAGLRVGGGFVILLSGIAMMNTHADDTKKAGRSLWRVVHDLVKRGHTAVHAAASVHASSTDAASSLATNAVKGGPDAVSTAVTQAVAGWAPPPPTSEESAAGRRAAFLTLMFPFAVPMILGPGFMSTILIATADNPSLTVLLALTANVGIAFVVFLLATPIRAVLGTFGMNILLRLVGLIVIVLAFEIMAAGLVKLLPGLAGAAS
ncbi:MarC family protein [Microbacterium sp. NPDC055910]|uniref:MarC family protein n=1 Tax=Microbacterium sp. NPDC055910 TaxID=3345659 RepID=UPI0035DDD3AF